MFHQFSLTAAAALTAPDKTSGSYVTSPEVRPASNITKNIITGRITWFSYQTVSNFSESFQWIVRILSPG